MKTFICEICGDAHLGEEKPSSCPFCGARASFIKLGKDAKPVVCEECNISKETKKSLLATLELERKAVALYNCMAGKTDSYEIKAMYKRLSAVELEHISIVCKVLKIEKPEPLSEECFDEMSENFKKTINLEIDATELYFKFARDAKERHIKILFTGLAQSEEDHIKLIREYL